MPDIVDLIRNDHREFERLFDKLRSEPAQRPNLLPVLTGLLAAHSRAEEAEVYPAAKDEAGEADAVEHSQEEHLLADKLLERLAGTDPEAADFESVLGELVEAVSHHIAEEEAKVLPGLRERLDEARLTSLGKAFLASREEHLSREPVDLRKTELLQQAANVGLEGASTMSKAELEKALAARAGS